MGTTTAAASALTGQEAATAIPWSALQQGAEDYLRRLVRTPTNSRVYTQTLQELQHLLDEWDAAPAAQRARGPSKS